MKKKIFFTIFLMTIILFAQSFTYKTTNIMESSLPDPNLHFDHIIGSGGSSSPADPVYKADLSFNNVISDSSVEEARNNIDPALINFTAAKYKPTVATKIYEFNGMKPLVELNTDGWRVGVIGHWFRINITSAYAVRGVYSHFPTFSKQVLESSNASMSLLLNTKYNTIHGNSLTFSESADVYISNKISSSYNINMSNTNKNNGDLEQMASTSMKYKYENVYTHNIVSSTTLASNLTINSQTAKYCPENYYISLGYFGNYYVFEYEYYEMKNWWGNDYICSDTIKGHFVVANEDKFSLTYILVDNKDNTYYC